MRVFQPLIPDLLAMAELDSAAIFLGDSFTTLRISEANGEEFDVSFLCFLTSAQRLEITYLGVNDTVIQTVKLSTLSCCFFIHTLYL